MNIKKIAKLSIKLAAVKLTKKDMPGESARLQANSSLVLPDIVDLLEKYQDKIINAPLRQILKELSDIVQCHWLKIELKSR